MAKATRREPLDPGGDRTPEDPLAGIRCRRCGCAHSRVVYAKPGPLNRRLRRRECRNCGARFTTYEETA